MEMTSTFGYLGLFQTSLVSFPSLSFVSKYTGRAIMTHIDSGMYNNIEYLKSKFLCLAGVFFFFGKECRASTFKGTLSAFNNATACI